MDKFKKINSYLCNIPSALGGLALAIASLGLCWENAASLDGRAQIFSAIVASFILLPLVLKFLFNPSLLKQDLQHPIAGSVTPTLTMVMMVIANAVALYSLPFAKVFSAFAILLHLFFLGVFIFVRSRNFKFEHILPSWFIPPIGLVLAPLMYPDGFAPVFAELFLQFGLLSYALLLPAVFYRILFCGKLSGGEKPTLVILATPASLILAVYFITTTQPSYLMVAILVLLALLMTLFVYFAFIKLLRLPFSPAYSSFTFPLVVSAIALFKLHHFLLKDGFDMQLIETTLQLANIELMIATLMVLYVSFRYIKFFYRLMNAE